MGLLSALFGCAKADAPVERTGGAWCYRDAPIPDAEARSLAPLSDHCASFAVDVDSAYGAIGHDGVHRYSMGMLESSSQ